MAAEKTGPLVRQLRVQSFGCIRDQTVELEPLTVLVGPNDSGKSMLLKALGALAEASRAEEGWATVYPTAEKLREQTFGGRGPTFAIGLEGCCDGMGYAYKSEIGARPGHLGMNIDRMSFHDSELLLEEGMVRLNVEDAPQGEALFAPNRAWPLLHPAWPIEDAAASEEIQRILTVLHRRQPLSRSLCDLRLYSLRPEDLRKPSVAHEKPRLGATGRGLAGMIAGLLLQERDALQQIESALRDSMPQVKRLDLAQRATDSGAIAYEIELITRSGARVPGHLISDGVLRFLAYLCLVLRPGGAPLLLIEEPETGLHPGLLRKLVQLFRDMTTGAHGGPPAQILLTTHSPMLLNLVEPEEIRVVQRGEDGATRITPFTSAPDLYKLLDHQGPGEIWVNQGEDYVTRGHGPS